MIIMIMMTLFVSQTEDCKNNQWGVSVRTGEDGSCYVKYEDYDKIATILKSVEDAPLEVEIPSFRILRDEAGRRYVKINDDKRVHVQIGYIHKSVPLILDDLFYIQEVPPPDPPSCLDSWYLRLSTKIGAGYYSNSLYFIGSLAGSALLPFNKWSGFDFTINTSFSTRLWPSWFDMKTLGGIYLLW